MKIDLNADLGEGFGPWKMGDDAALMEIITSANVACGFHAGDPQVMAAAMRAAVKNGVGLGAHPGFDDRQGFGRRRIPMPHDELAELVAYQVAAAQGMARRAGGRLNHVKLHGALSNMASEDEAMARACYEAALTVDPDLTIMVLAATPMEAAVRAIGCTWVGEIFADRAYLDDATLKPRGQPGAVLHDADEIVPRLLKMIEKQAIVAESGKEIPCQVDTVCLHGDTPGAVAIARQIRDGLTEAGVTLERF